jgi:hypothetical protein
MRSSAHVFILLSAIGCREAIDTIADKRTRDVLSTSSFRIELVPEPSPHLQEGGNVPIQVRAVFRSGEVCRYCEVSWSSSAPEVALVSKDPRCGSGRCVILEGLAPGSATLSVEVCQGYDRGCVRRKIEVRVAR